MFAATAKDAADHPFLIVPARADRDWHPNGVAYSYGDTLREVERLRDLYVAAGYGHGHRVSILLENRPEFFFHYLALNARRRLHRADQSRLPARRSRLSARPQRGGAGRGAAASRGRRGEGRRRARQAAARRRCARHAGRAAASAQPGSAFRCIRSGERMLAALHVRNHGAAEGLSAVEPLYAERRRDLSATTAD